MSPELDLDEYPRADPAEMTPEQAYNVLDGLSRLRATKLPIPKTHKFSRAEVVNSFASAFELIGGTTRLALWANENPGEFYKLFGKLLPSSSVSEIMHYKSPTDARELTTAELEEIVRTRLTEGKVIDIEDYQRNFDD